MRYAENFKKAMVQKMLTPGGKGIGDLSEELGVSTQTLYNWRNLYGRAEDIIRSPRQWIIKGK